MSLLNQKGLNLLDSNDVLSIITFEKSESQKSVSKLNISDIFKDKTIVVFGLPGAFTPTCSSTHLPRYEQLNEEFKKNGVDDIYCVSVNDPFVMTAWGKSQGIEKTKLIADGNGTFTELMGMLVSKEDLDFGNRSWRYSAIIKDGVIVEHFVEPEIEGDPFEVSDADTMFKLISPEQKPKDDVTIFTKEGCNFCFDAKKLLKDNGFRFTEVSLDDSIRNKVLRSISPNKTIVPQIFVNGVHYSGLDELKKLIENMDK